MMDVCSRLTVNSSAAGSYTMSWRRSGQLRVKQSIRFKSALTVYSASEAKTRIPKVRVVLASKVKSAELFERRRYAQHRDHAIGGHDFPSAYSHSVMPALRLNVKSYRSFRIQSQIPKSSNFRPFSISIHSLPDHLLTKSVYRNGTICLILDPPRSLFV